MEETSLSEHGFYNSKKTGKRAPFNKLCIILSRNASKLQQVEKSLFSFYK